jgi:hypothetical protein
MPNSHSQIRLVSVRFHHDPGRARVMPPSSRSRVPALIGPRDRTASITSETSSGARAASSPYLCHQPGFLAPERNRGQSCTGTRLASCAQYSTSGRGGHTGCAQAASSSSSFE